VTGVNLRFAALVLGLCLTACGNDPSAEGSAEIHAEPEGETPPEVETSPEVETPPEPDVATPTEPEVATPAEDVVAQDVPQQGPPGAVPERRPPRCNRDVCAAEFRDRCPTGSYPHSECQRGRCVFTGCASPIRRPEDFEPPPY
jgi:hypothetical protein